MSVSEEGGGSMMSLTDSFWEIGQYKRSVKRIDDGSRLCSDLMTMLKERGEIEASYAKQLRSWSKRWNDTVEKGPEHGTMQRAWQGVLEEAEKRHDLHTRIRDRVMEEVYNTVKLWMKDNFHQKALGVGGIKESKEIEESFRKAQKPWAKLYTKVDKTKKEYHTACKAERSAINHDKNASGDSSVSLDQQKKLAEKVEKCREEKEKTRSSYESALRELNAYNAKYMEDMTQVFVKCQEMEMKRLKFFKEMLFGFHKCLDLSQETKLESIYKDYWETVNGANSDVDLSWWEQAHGTGMPMNWPVFEEYSPEMRRITKKEKRGHDGGDGVILVGQKHVDSPMATMTASNQPSRTGYPSISAPMPNGGNVDRNMNQTSDRGDGNAPASPTPFDDEWDEAPTYGVTVRAMYDYTAQEEDEISFKKGEEFEKLEDEDEQGWCKGRKDGRVGLYPANYAAPP